MRPLHPIRRLGTTAAMRRSGAAAVTTLISVALLIPVVGVAVTLAAPSPAGQSDKLHVCITADKLLRLAPGNNGSFCKPGQKKARLAQKAKKGKPGKDGVSGWQRVVGSWSADTEGQRTVIASCPAGKKVVGGGFETGNVSDAREIVVRDDYPSAADTWSVTALADYTGGNKSFAIRAYALCVTAI